MQIAITGATGFLGSHLMREFLRGDGTFTLLARRGSADSVTRLTSFLELARTPPRIVAQLAGRVRVVQVDVGVPRLGLSEDRFRELADSVDVVWHCAGSIELDGDPEALRRTNVTGTAGVLELVDSGARVPTLIHVSTAFVAGARRAETAFEDVLDDAAGFENPYERSKFEAETLVRDWARRTGRTAVVLRPSILVTDLAPHPALPLHPLTYLHRSVNAAARVLGLAGARKESDMPRLRVLGDPLGHLNFMPVEETASAMVRITERAPSGLNTYNVVHHHDVPTTVVLDVLRTLAPVRLTMVPHPPAQPTPLERTAKLYRGFAPYLTHRRLFDDTRARTLIGEPETHSEVDLDYLLASIGRAP